MSTSYSMADFYATLNSEWQKQGFPQQNQLEDWESPCVVSEDQGRLTWQPLLRDPQPVLDNVEFALELSLHPSVKDLFCSHFAGELNLEFAGLPVDLVQVWNDADFDYLQENIIGHILMQRRLKQADSIFIASTDDEMKVISIINSTGEVVLENLGKGLERVLADSLAEFLQGCQLRLEA